MPPPPGSTLFPYTTLFRSVPAPVLAVLGGVDGHVDASGERGDVDQLGPRTIGGREVVVAAGDRGTNLLGQIGRASCRERGEIDVVAGGVDGRLRILDRRLG